MLSLNGKIEGIDTSQYQDNFDTTRKPDLTKSVALGAKFGIYRSSYGRTEDPLFGWYYNTGNPLMPSGIYHYMDYYSHAWYGMNSSQWGRAQADKIIEICNRYGIKKIPIFIDVESASPHIAPRVDTVWGTAVTILDNMLARLDDYFGEATGIYSSTGHSTQYHSYHKWRPYWAANYNPITTDQLRSIVAGHGWTDLVAWQYASHGDINKDNIPDGIRMGMETSTLDLNLWMKDEKAFNAFFGAEVPVVDPPIIIDEPDDEVQAPETKTKQVEVKTVMVRSLKVRQSKSAPTLFSPAPDRLSFGTEVEILERVVSGKYTWARIGYRQWACEKEGTAVYLQ